MNHFFNSDNFKRLFFLEPIKGGNIGVFSQIFESSLLDLNFGANIQQFEIQTHNKYEFLERSSKFFARSTKESGEQSKFCGDVILDK